MKTLNLLLLTLMYLFLNHAQSYAQCDADLFREVEKTKPEVFTFLKNYDIKIADIAGVPMNKEYSYVLSKGTQYLFNLYQSKENSEIVTFKVINSRKEEVPLIVVEQNEQMTSYLLDCEATGIYYFIFYTENSTNSCAVMQLSFLRVLQVTNEENTACLEKLSKEVMLPNKPGRTLKTLNLSFDKKEKSSKLFVLRSSNKEEPKVINHKEPELLTLNYSYVFTKGETYNFHILGSIPHNDAFSINLKDSQKREVSLQGKQEGNYFQYTYTADKTGIFFINIEQTEKVEACFTLVLTQGK